jgi:transposase
LVFGDRRNTRGVGVVMARWDRDRVSEWLRDPSRRGKRLIEERGAYFALVDAGVGVRDAARTVGVNYRTAKRWNAAARAAAIDQARTAVADPAGREISTRYLSGAERIVIADRVREKASLRSIAAQLNGRPRMTLDYDTPAERLATLLAG